SLARYLSGDRETKASTERRKRIQAGVEIAVIGMSGRFPGAKTIAEFWNNLKNGVESITCLTGEELRQMGVEETLLENPAFVPAKGRLQDIEYFDSLFFGYTPSEAAIMDPQMRIFHECCWEALENAGYAPGTGEGDIGLYAGASPNPLWEILPLKPGTDTGHLHLNARQWEALQLSDKDYLSTRIAYKLNLTGPVVTLQTACSTSLSAVILACQGLVSGTCDMALAGGVSVTFYDQVGYLYQEGAIMSQDGHCKAFDDAATGTVGGNGAGVVVLKRLADAAADGDNITAVIKGFAINNDGKNKAGFTAPGVEGQARVIRNAQRMAGVGPGTIGYVETHGTGTRLGDPIEIEALKQAFDPERVNKRNYCALGSVKANIGHLDAAAGIAGFIKTVLVLMHRSIPPGLHFETPNPGIDFENSPFYINRILKEWKSTEYPLRAGISSFGIGGTNAHVVLEEYPEGTRGLALLPVAPLPEEHPSREYQLILLSAKTPTALDKMTENLAEYLKNNLLNPGNHENPTNPGPTLADAAYTLQTGKKAFSHRRMLVCKDNREAIDILASTGLNHLEGAGQVKTFQTQTENPFIVFMFPGQGAQYVNMGRELYEKEPVFREEMNRCFGILKPLMGHDLKEILYPFYRSNGYNRSNRSNRSYKSYTSYINQTEITQPVIFAFEYALARLLILWGIQPRAMIGHSIGEYTAACLSGVFSLEDALKLVTWRGKLMQGVPGGSMLSVPLPEEELTPLLDQELSIAAVNSTSHCVVSGSHETAAAFARRLKDKGFSSRRLHTSHAFHSKMMEPVLEKFEKTINDLHIKLNPARIPFISNVTGHWITDEETVNPHYWAVHLRKTVRFADGLAQLFKIDGRVFVEVGPGQVLSTFTRQYHHKSVHPAFSDRLLVTNLVPHPQEDVPGEGYLLTKLGELWLYGVKIHWPGFYLEEKRSRIALPTYPFEGKRFPVPVDAARGSFKEGVILYRKPHLEDWFYIPAWEQLILPPPPSLGCLKSFNWLIFVDQGGLGDKLVNQLESVGPDVITVRIGQGFSKVRNHVYTINPHSSGDYDDLFLELKKLKRVPGRIVHLWGVTGEGGKEAGFEALDRTQDFGLYSLLNVVQAAARQQITGEIQVEIVVNGIYEVTGEELIQPEKATVLGAVKVIPLEYRNIKCRCLDIVKPVNGIESETKLLHRLLTEFAYTVDSTGNIVALRGNYRWLQRMKPLKLENPQPENQRLKQGGVYLVTGGLGGIGLTLAEHLAACCKAKLVLVGRSSFPQKKQWKEWLANHHENDNISSKILKLQQIEASGAEIMVASANAADARQMEKVIADALERFGKINGVLHAAGAADDNGIIQGRTKEMTEQVMAAKVKGTLVLDHLLKDMEPDFIALFSSLGNITWGLNFGQVGYNAANEFLDAYAYFKNTRDGIFTVSINWPAWKQVGMAERARKQDIPGYEAILENALLPAEGKEVFSRILESNLPRIAVSPVDLPVLLQQYKEVADGVFQEVVSPRYPRPQLSTPYAPPRNEIQQALVNIFEEFFGINPIGIRDNFFELGGDSLKAMGVSAKIHKELNVEVPLAEFFSRPTVEALARYISDKTGKTLYSSIEPTEQKDYYALSSAQKRLYFLQQMDLESSSYNMTMVLPLNGAGKDINKERLETTLRKLISRHESLRTSFLMMGEEPVQRIHDEVEFEIEYYKVEVEEKEAPFGQVLNAFGGHSPKSQELRAKSWIHSFIRPFDLSQAPLVRSGLIRLPDRSYTWIVDMHHIICDGTSGMIMAEDFTSLYHGEQLESLRLRYKDFSHWQNRLFVSGKIISQEKYWLELYCDAGHIPRLPLPTDFKRPQVFTFAGGRYVFNLDREDVLGFRELALRHGATLYMNILAALNTLFYRYTGQPDIIIGSGTAGRRHSDLQGIIGMFVNTLAMRNYPDGEKTYEFFLHEVTASSIRAFDNQDVQFEELVDKLDLERDPSRNPLFDISMVVQNFRKPGERGKRREKIGREEILPLGDENLFDLDYMNTTSKFDMTFFISEPGQEVSIMIEYYTGIYKEETIRQMARHFKNLVKAVIKEPCQRLKDIEIISPVEKRMVLYDFNAVSRDYPLEKSIHSRIAGQVQETPDNVALVYEDYALTYRELEERANRVAGYLYKKGIRPEEGVGILLDKGIEIVVALLGTLKAGGAYIPMESSFPSERQKHIIIDAQIGVVLSEKSQIRDLNRLQWECDCFHSYLCLDSDDVYAEEEVEKNELMNRELWEHVGENAADEIAGGGWVSSYTGEPMSKQEMDEYGDNVLKKLTPLLHEEMRVLEIGTASGITMYRIAPKVGLYYGTDLSSVIIDKNREKVKQEGHQNIKLACLAADEIDKIEEKDFDLIIINSVIQSFHGHNYLGQVMVKCIGLLGERGYLFIGDIMDQDKKLAMVRELTAF
ncbi:MAG: acyltransferase domain-containing protein, partial [Candidatus Aminicenantes bacterium]